MTRPPAAQRLIAMAPLAVAVAFFVAFVLLPLGAMLVETVVAENGLTLAAYAEILARPVDRVQLLNSVELGFCATGIAFAFGFGHAWLTWRTDLPLGKVLGPLGIAPLVIPPILVAMGTAYLIDAAGFWACAALLGVSYAPFVAVMTARGLRSLDGRLYEAALLARGRLAADRLLFRMILPEVLAGCLFAFIFVVSEHGVPEFLTVKGKNWHTYAEGVFARWTTRATGDTHQDLVSAVVAALPLCVLIAVALAVAFRLRARSSADGEFQPMPVRPLGRGRWPALLWPLVYLGFGVGVPVAVMGMWAAGSTQVKEPMSFSILRKSFRAAFVEAGDDLARTIGIGAATTIVLIAVAVPLSRLAARRLRLVDHLSVLPLAVPAILLSIGLVRIYNSPVVAQVYGVTGDFYDSWGIVAFAYAARFLPFAVLTLSHATRRVPASVEEAALLSGRGPVARAFHIHLPVLLPAIWSAACLIFVLALRELDIAVVLPSGNGTVVRRLSNVVHFGGEDLGGALALLLLLAAVLVPFLTILVSGRRLRSLS